MNISSVKRCYQLILCQRVTYLPYCMVWVDRNVGWKYSKYSFIFNFFQRQCLVNLVWNHFPTPFWVWIDLWNRGILKTVALLHLLFNSSLMLKSILAVVSFVVFISFISFFLYPTNFEDTFKVQFPLYYCILFIVWFY